MSEISLRLAEVEARIRRAAARGGRDRESIRLIAVSKTRPAADLRAAFAAGVVRFGENRVQEAEQKIAEGLPAGVELHLIGHLQANKARAAARAFPWIHSIDSIHLLERLDSLAEREIQALVQVDLAREPTKHGLEPDRLPAVLAATEKLARVRVRGLMCLPPLAEDPEQARPWFRRLRELRDAHGGVGRLPELSMGMSHDFEVAIEEGATFIRVGEAVFGPRQAKA